MKTIIILLICVCSLLAQTQNNIPGLSLKKPIQLTEEQQFMILIKRIMNDYGYAFRYYKNLQSGLFKFSIVDKEGYYLLILDKDNKTIDKIKLIKSLENSVYSLKYKDDEINRCIDHSKLQSVYATRQQATDMPDVIVQRDNILNDQIIIEYEGYRDFKVFNKSYAEEHFYNSESELAHPIYEKLEDAKILPYDNGEHEKFVSVDSWYNSVVFINKDFDYNNASDYFARYYCEFGGDSNQLSNPTGITYGRPVEYGDYYIYPIYIADQHNNRIIRSEFKIHTNNKENPGFDPATFSIIADDSIMQPSDIEFCKAKNSHDDKLWASEFYGNGSLVCMDLSGDIVTKIKGFRYGGGTIIYFTPGATLRLTVYNEAFDCVGFVYSNEENNSICTFTLDEYGEPDDMFNDSVVNVVREHMDGSHKLTSIHIQNIVEYSELYPYMWVTSEDMIHDFAINKFAGFAYLASTPLPRTTDWYFTDLQNLSLNNGYYDMLSIEDWTTNYGIRHYYPFADIRSDEVTAYCDDSSDVLMWKAVFTNECWAKVWVKRKAGIYWEDVPIKMIDGFTQMPGTYEATIFRFKGHTAVTGEDPIEIKLKLPLKDYIFGDSLKVFAKIFPDYNPPDGSDNYTYREYTTYIEKKCLPRPIGCPFLYIREDNDQYAVDNNLLHRSEFSDSAIDITDRYILQVDPFLDHGSIEVAIVENEDDVSMFNVTKMWAVDYPIGMKLAITEDNEIVLYDSSLVTASDSVTLNGSDLTSYLNFHSPGLVPIEGAANDSLYAHFSYPPSLRNNWQYNKELIPKRGINENDRSVKHGDYANGKNSTTRSILLAPKTIAFISNLSNIAEFTPGPKDTSGYLSAVSTYSNLSNGIFARRERASDVVLPLFQDPDSVDHLTVKWQNEYRIRHVGIAYLEYGGYDINEMPLTASAITLTSETDETEYLETDDGKYSEVNQNQFFKLRFDGSKLPSLTKGYERKYIIEVKGYYTSYKSNLQNKAIVELPKQYSLSQNYPNPFNPTTKINFELPKNSQVTLIIYDILGREVTKLVNNEFKQAGRYAIDFNAQNYASGVYFYRIEAGTFVQAKKMVLVK